MIQHGPQKKAGAVDDACLLAQGVLTLPQGTVLAGR